MCRVSLTDYLLYTCANKRNKFASAQCIQVNINARTMLPAKSMNVLFTQIVSIVTNNCKMKSRRHTSTTFSKNSTSQIRFFYVKNLDCCIYIWFLDLFEKQTFTIFSNFLGFYTPLVSDFLFQLTHIDGFVAIASLVEIHHILKFKIYRFAVLARANRANSGESIWTNWMKRSTIFGIASKYSEGKKILTDKQFGCKIDWEVMNLMHKINI